MSEAPPLISDTQKNNHAAKSDIILLRPFVCFSSHFCSVVFLNLTQYISYVGGLHLLFNYLCCLGPLNNLDEDRTFSFDVKGAIVIWKV